MATEVQRDMRESAAPGVPGRAAEFLPVFLVVLTFFFLSGAAGLLYQVVWTRKLVLLFGTTAYAVSTVLSIFFLGLGVGSLWGGRLADRHPRPLQLYGIFEIIIAVWAFVFILTVAYGEGVVVALLKLFDWSRGAGILLRTLMAALLLFVPVAMMGATLPLLSKFVTRESWVRGRRIGVLYTVNTLGAVAGCFVTGFFLISLFGYTLTTFIGAVANAAVGVLALLVSRRYETGSALAAPPPAEATPVRLVPSPLSPAKTRLVLALFALSGFCALALEVLWTRLLVIVFLGTTYAYTTMLTTLLIGIALGSAVASAFVDRISARLEAFGAVLVLSGAFSIGMLALVAGMPEKIIELHRAHSTDWGGVVRGKFLLSFLALLPPTFFFGMTFPLVVKALSGGRDTLGWDVGRLYSANTFGGVLGALAGGFLIIPALGTHNGILLLGGLLVLAGGALLLLPPFGARKTALAAALAVLALVAYVRAPEDVSLALNAGYIPSDHRVIFYEEGVEGTVAVSEPEDEPAGRNRVLWINRVQATASIERGVKMNRLQGVLPLLYDRDPASVLFMCFGSGITCGTLALSDFERIDAVEISPDVLAAAPLFDPDNLGVIDNPHIRFHVDDGRNFLLRTDNKYDVITFEPMPLALAGVSTFYTRDYYELCLRRLAPGGMVSQWVPLHSLNPEVVRSLVYTFTSVFPHYNAWFINADLFLMGSDEPLQIDVARAEARLSEPALREALEEVWMPDLPEVLASFLLDEAGLDAYAAGGELMTDDRPWAEFIAPKLVYAREVPASIEALRPHITPLRDTLAPGVTPETLAVLERRHAARIHDLVGLQQYYSGLNIGPEALNAFLASLEIDPDNYNAQYYIKEILDTQVEVFLRWEDFEQVEEIVSRVIEKMPHDPELHYWLGAAHAGQGNEAAAEAAFARHRELGGTLAD